MSIIAYLTCSLIKAGHRTSCGFIYLTFLWLKHHTSSAKLDTGLPTKLDTGLPTKLDTGLPTKQDTGLPTKLDTGLPIKDETSETTVGIYTVCFLLFVIPLQNQ